MTKARQLSKLLGGSVPSALDTLNEIATALGNDASLATTLTNSINAKLSKAGDTLTGPFDMGGNRIRDISGSARVYYNLTPHYDMYASGSTAGALVIDTNIPYNDSNMCAIKIAGYSYNSAQPWEINVSGYFGENNFYALNASSLAHPFPTVQVARKTATNKMSIILGSLTGVYGTSIYVERFLQSYTNISAANADGWTISRITSTTAYSSVTTVPLEKPVLQDYTLGASLSKSYVPGGLSYGEADRGYYVLGWKQIDASSSYSYCHIKTNLWGGGSPRGNDMYIMGGFKLTGYIYSSYNINELHQFHNWSGSMAGYIRTINGNEVNNTVYISSDGYVTLRLASGQYAAYNIDLYQQTLYARRDITIQSITKNNNTGI
jgi:hypothetical protein